MLSDGHSLRFSIEALNFAFGNGITLFLGPLDSTSVTQALDQVNSVLYKGYFYIDSYINREIFMTNLADIWPNWVTEQGINNAFKKVGIKNDGLSTEWMQQEKFLATENITSQGDAGASILAKSSMGIIESSKARNGSMKCYKEELDNTQR